MLRHPCNEDEPVAAVRLYLADNAVRVTCEERFYEGFHLTETLLCLVNPILPVMSGVNRHAES